MTAFITCYKLFLSPTNIGKRWYRLSCYRGAVNEFLHFSAKPQNCKIHTCLKNVKRTDIVKGKQNSFKVFMNTSALDVNTKVEKDVIMFHHENPKFYRNLNLFAICQFGFWTYLSHFAFTSLRDAPSPKDQDNLPWWRRINLGENKYKNGLTILCFLIGYGILASSWLFTLKSVRYLILRKGGDKLTFVTYTPFGKNRMLTVDMNKVSCQESRQVAKALLPIAVKNYRLYFMLDMKGEFRNAKLFDHTAGLRRNWKM